jgi:prepilin-type N-terminal cleavage/methylation domain-containing protein
MSPRSPQLGFSLLEVMIALTLFAVFVSTFLVTQGYNISDSALNEEQLLLHQLCDTKMQETLINPPRFTNALKDTKEVKSFENKEYANYTYTIEWKKLKVPDFGKIFAANAGAGGEPGAEDDNSGYFDDNQRGRRNTSVEKLVFDRMKENIERAVWQLRLTVTNKETNYSYTLSRWLTNYDEPIQLNLSF